MNFKKVLGALAVMLAMTTVACGGGEKESAAPESKPASSETAPESKPASSEAAPASSEAAPTTSEATVDYTVILPRTWTDGTAAQNSDNKEYVPLTDAAAGKVGVKISIQNYTVGGEVDGTAVTSTTALGSDGKINPGNDHNAYLTYKVTAPKAGDYQLVMRGKSSTSNNALGKTLDERAFDVRLNGAKVDVQSSRAPFADSNGETIDFVAAPTISLTGQEDTIMISASDYRIQFDTASFLLFQEH